MSKSKRRDVKNLTTTRFIPKNLRGVPENAYEKARCLTFRDLPTRLRPPPESLLN